MRTNNKSERSLHTKTKNDTKQNEKEIRRLGWFLLGANVFVVIYPFIEWFLFHR